MPIQILRALKEDLPIILELQYLAYQSEAKLLNNFKIPPLRQTLKDVDREFRDGIILKALNERNEIIGSIRGYVEDGTLFIGKLIVHPDFQGQGIGTNLLQKIEKICPQKRCQLFTSDKSIRNLTLYERLGYIQYKREQVSSDLGLIYLEKLLTR